MWQGRPWLRTKEGARYTLWRGRSSAVQCRLQHRSRYAGSVAGLAMQSAKRFRTGPEIRSSDLPMALVRGTARPPRAKLRRTMLKRKAAWAIERGIASAQSAESDRWIE